MVPRPPSSSYFCQSIEGENPASPLDRGASSSSLSIEHGEPFEGAKTLRSPQSLKKRNMLHSICCDGVDDGHLEHFSFNVQKM
ncbi:hypothetical protein MRB53_033264 [Persea americana]|uniref:Uncharacterized protein n=1 Tax=Persea americana TaxID=3435 RepID=A0ACC2KVD4_PERAE|nr:hypothetical protein MRB53_033264 [Persea americana]